MIWLGMLCGLAQLLLAGLLDLKRSLLASSDTASISQVSHVDHRIGLSDNLITRSIRLPAATDPLTDLYGTDWSADGAF